MWKRLLNAQLRRIIRQGQLELTYADGSVETFGDGSDAPLRVRLTDPAFARKCAKNTELAVGEAYMDGTLQIENDDLRGFFELALKNKSLTRSKEFARLYKRIYVFFNRLNQYNRAARSKANVAHHYDLNEKLYDLFLDEDRQYSCAYFKSGDDTLEQAQAQKKAHIADKLLISDGMRVLDIGCGWGGMALTLAQDYGAHVVGVTLSEEQHKLARKRVAEAGLEDMIDIRLQDYRDLDEPFDRIVSVGMFEHVGVPQYETYFEKVRDLLSDDGIALIHTIGRTSPPGGTSAWIEKYIFPGGYCPAMSEVMRYVEVADLYPTDVEVWRIHYAETLRHWHDRFMANIDAARGLYDERFCRMWRYYLMACEMTFRHDHQCVFQFQLAKRQESVPLTRDYLYQQAPAEEVERLLREEPLHAAQ